MEVPHGVAVVLRVFGILLILFALVDFGLSWVGIDITGVSWSPLVAGGLGSVIWRVFRSADSDDDD